MGTYLSKPITEKVSTDAKSKFISYGASSMQGWRIYQEDAHNTMLDFDENKYLFAVYDGHGGHEVAVYTAAKLPDFLKNNDNYKKGNYSESLREAFLDFDATLIGPEILPILKEIAGTKDEDDSDYDGEEVNHLCREATMPLEEVMAKYSDPLSEMYSQTLKAKEVCLDECNNKSNGSSSSSCINSEPCSSKVNNCSYDKEAGTSALSPSKIEAENKVSSNPSDSTEKDTQSKVSDSDISPSGNISSKCDSVEISSLSNLSQVNGDKADVSSKLSSEEEENNSNATSLSLEEKSQVKSETVNNVTESNEKNPFKKKKNFISPKLEAVKTDKRVLQKRKALQIIMEQSLKIVNPEDDSEDDDDDSYGEVIPKDSGFNGEDSNSEEEPEETSDDSDEDSEADYEEEEEEEEDEEDVEEDKNYNEFAMNMREEPGFDSGCTACVVLGMKSKLIVANVGDSRCVVCRGGNAVDMSIDHKPEDDEESSRIRKAGGKITSDGRVNGGLNLSRALGDHSYKQNKIQKPEDQMISPLPDIQTLEITPDDQFMIIACDGIWNSLSSQEACDFVSERLKENTKLSSICEEMFDHCLAPDVHGDGTGCDNMTCIIVRFDHDSDLEPASEHTIEATDKKRCISECEVSDNSDGSLEKKAKLELISNGTDILEK